MKIHGWEGPDAATKPLVSPRLPRHKEWTEKAEKRNSPASTDIWLLRGDNQVVKEPHGFAFSPSSKLQQAGLLPCCLARTKLHAHTPPHANPDTSPHLFSTLPPLQQFSGSPPWTSSCPHSVLSPREWNGYLIPLITCQYWPHFVASASFQHSSYKN